MLEMSFSCFWPLYKWMHTVVLFCVWHLELNSTSVRFIQGVARSCSSCLLLYRIPLDEYLTWSDLIIPASEDWSILSVTEIINKCIFKYWFLPTFSFWNSYLKMLDFTILHSMSLPHFHLFIFCAAIYNYLSVRHFLKKTFASSAF